MSKPLPPLLAVASLLVLAACQGLPFVLGSGAAAPGASAPPAPTPTPPAGACAAPAVVIPAGGVPYAVASGFAPPESGTCVPVRDFLTGRVEVQSAGGGYRLSIELPGRPAAAGAPARLRVGLRYASGSQPAIPDAAVRVKRQLIAPGGPVTEDALTSEAGAYVLDGLTWPQAGRWLVTVFFTVGAEAESAHLAIDVGL